MTQAPRATLNGADLSGPSPARATTGRKCPTGQTFYDEDLARLLVRDARGRGLFGVDGNLVNDTTAASRYYADHFKASVISTAFDKTKGSDGAAVAFAIDTTVKAGAVKATTGAAGTGAAADAVTLSLNNPIQLGAATVVELSASILLSAWTNVMFFVGFTDTLPGTTLELPYSLSVVTYTSTATDAVGFLFDTAATTDTIRLVGVAADVDAANIDTGLDPAVINSTLDMHIRLEGTTAYFGIDGQTIATNKLLLAASTGVNLYPIIVAVPRAAASRDVTVDFLRGGKFA